MRNSPRGSWVRRSEGLNHETHGIHETQKRKNHPQMTNGHLYMSMRIGRGVFLSDDWPNLRQAFFPAPCPNGRLRTSAPSGTNNRPTDGLSVNQNGRRLRARYEIGITTFAVCQLACFLMQHAPRHSRRKCRLIPTGIQPQLWRCGTEGIHLPRTEHPCRYSMSYFRCSYERAVCSISDQDWLGLFVSRRHDAV